MTVLVQGMKGLGDCIYQRAFIRRLVERETVYLETPWPELYVDLGVRFVKGDTRLRTQAKNIARQPSGIWSQPPAGCRKVRNRYQFPPGIVPGMAQSLGIQPGAFDLPIFGPPPIESRRPLAVVRPVTERREWRSSARNPRPEYIAEAASALRQRGYYTVSVADVERGAEWFVGDPPAVDATFHRGEFTAESLLALVRHASVIVGGVGWIVPAAIAAGRPLFCILGGRGAHNAPDVITHSTMNLSRVSWFTPDRFCRCENSAHDCDKAISGFGPRFVDSLESVA